MEDYDFLFKVIVLGDGGAGKTALTVRFAQGYFQDSYKMTVGVDFSVKLIEVGDKRVKLQTWDTGGQERFSFVRPLYYRGAMGALLVFDVSNRESFEHLPNWIEELESNADPVPFVLVGNKIDLPREVDSEEAWNFAQQFGIKYYYETSAKTGEAVGDCFHALAYEMIGIPLPDDAYPDVMRRLGAAPGAAPSPAPAQTPVSSPAPAASSGKLQVPEVSKVPIAPEFDMADEYSELDAEPATQNVAKPAPQAQPLPKPSPKPLPKPQQQPAAQPMARPVPKPQPLPKPQPIKLPQVQPVKASKHVVEPEPQATSQPRPVPKSLPKPTPVKIPVEKPQAIGLFSSPSSEVSPAQASGDGADEPPMEMPELPAIEKPGRRAKPIPVSKKSAEEAIPSLSGSGGASRVPSSPEPSSESSLGLSFQAASQPSPTSLKPIKKQVDSGSASGGTMDLSQALSARGSKASESSSGGFIPFSSGFTPAGASASAGAGEAKKELIGFFISNEIPDNILKPRKKKGNVKADELKKCPSCGYTVRATMKFCNKCGQKL